MRVGYLSYFHPEWHAECEIADHLESELGWIIDRCELEEIDPAQFLAQCGNYDLVITAGPHRKQPDFWRAVKKAGPTLIAWYFDWVFGFSNRERQYLSVLKDFDLVVSTDGFEDQYAKYGIKRTYLPHGVDTRIYKPVKPDPLIRSDIAFIGHVYMARREKMLRTLLENFNARIFGTKDDCWGTRYSEICNSVKIVVGDNFRNDIAGYWSDRLYLSLASGAFLLHPDVGGMPFEDGKHLVLWHDTNDLVDKIRYYLDRPEERKRIAEAGVREAQNHSWTVRVKEFEAGFGRLYE